jgi:hypothetical protein
MTFPDRTRKNVTLPGAASATKVLRNSADGVDADGADYIEGFIATEETGVGRVETEGA